MFALSRNCRAIKSLPKLLTAQTIHTNNILFKNRTEHLKLEINGEQLEFPFVWLRDNCQCEQCYHHSAKSRILDWSYFDPNIKAKNIEKQANSIQVTWPDGHTSNYKYDWLKFRNFTPQAQNNYTDTIYKPRKQTWEGKDFETVCIMHNYNDIINTDKALYDWLKNLSVYGVAIIEGTPENEKALDEIVSRIGFNKQTHYGVQFVVQNVPNTSNVAYLSSNLQMHTDLPYYEYCPGTNLLHCLVQTESSGGVSLLSDCHYVAYHMKENHPEEYKLLTDVEVEWSDIGVENGNEFFKLYRSPVIVLNKFGEVIRINFSVPQRGSHFPGNIDDVVPWYKAHSLFYKLNHDFAARFKLKAGWILAFDNIRLLHGRTAYEDNQKNVRKLIGGYVDWDEIYSRLRCLKVKLHNGKGIL